MAHLTISHWHHAMADLVDSKLQRSEFEFQECLKL